MLRENWHSGRKGENIIDEATETAETKETGSPAEAKEESLHYEE